MAFGPIVERLVGNLVVCRSVNAEKSNLISANNRLNVEICCVQQMSVSLLKLQSSNRLAVMVFQTKLLSSFEQCDTSVLKRQGNLKA